MKKMNKMIATLLVAVMMMSAFCVNIFAYEMEITDSRGENVADIYVGEIAEGTNIWEAVNMEDEAARVCIVVEWDRISFTYDFGGEWNPETLTYENIPGWKKEENKITVYNRSNCDVEVFISFQKNEIEAFENVDISFNEDSVVLASAHDRDIDTLDSFDFFLEAKGAPTDYIKSGELGTVLVSIAAADAEEQVDPTNTTDPEEEEGGEHEHHFVYDQFGRLVCTGCSKVAHEYCIDEDEDGLCDECGLERDFCEDCHYGGKCMCI